MDRCLFGAPVRGAPVVCAAYALVCSMLLAGASRDALAEPADSFTMPSPLSLEWCLERADQENPALASAHASADAARHRVGPAGALEDPRISYDASNLPTGDFDFDSTPLSGHQLGIRQKLPLPGLLSNRSEAARRGAEAARLHAEDRRFEIESAVEVAWAELAFAQQALEITRRNIELLRQLSATAESLYRVGSGLQQDVLRAHVELTALLQERLRRVEAVSRAEAELAALLDLPPSVTFSETDPLSGTSGLPPLDETLAGLQQSSPQLLAAAERVEQARLQIKVAELEGLPDVDLGIGYRIRSNVEGDPVRGDDFVSAGLTVRLPVDRSKWRSRVAEQRAWLRRAEAELRGTRAALEARTRRAHAELTRAAAEEVLLETGLVPQARQSLESSRSAYEVGRVEFLSVLDSQVRLFDAELRLARARADQHRAFAALESAAGEKIR